MAVIDRHALREGRDAVLLSYAQVYFSQSRTVGALLLAATLLAPRLGLAGLASVLVALATARALRLSPELTRTGLYGYNALLVGLGGAALLEAGPLGIGLTLLAVVASVLVTAALQSAFAAQALPVLTLPFLVVTSLLLAAANQAGVPTRPFPGEATALLDFGWQGAGADALRALGTVFFSPTVTGGVLMLAALLVYSRIATALALGALSAAALAHALLLPGSGAVAGWELGFNMLFAAVALGGVWFVPGRWSVALAALGVALVGLVTLALRPVVHFLGFPVLVWPLNLTLLGVLLALRQRVRDGRPKAVDFVPGSPEENQDYYLTRVARFGARYGLRLHAPFRGRWVCTQGTDGPHTHRGPWRHGADFEVLGADGRRQRGTGERNEDWHCYRLPVLATADGTVVRVVDGVPDNPPGRPDLHNRWGNTVVLYHGPGLYSLVAHLAPGSVGVREGQFVRQGAVLGLCGSSGRSPAPHLHFQLQASAVVGAPTVELELNDVVVEREGEELPGTLVPAEGDSLRNLDPRPELRQLLDWTIDEPLVFRVEEGGRAWEETVEPRVELLGQTVLHSPGRGTLYYDAAGPLLVVYDVVGRRESVLHLLRAALGRVPYEPPGRLSWTDRLPARHFLPLARRLGLGFRRPAALGEGVRVRHRGRQEGQDLVITGAAEPGVTALATEAVLRRGVGIWSLTLTVGGRTARATRLIPEPARKR